LDENEAIRRILTELHKLEHTPITVFDGKNANQISVVKYAQVLEVMKPLKEKLKESRLTYFNGKLIKIKKSNR
jgi:Mg2+/Co2+ transporter CorB